MKIGYKLSVLGVVVILLALSAYVVLGVGGGDAYGSADGEGDVSSFTITLSGDIIYPVFIVRDRENDTEYNSNIGVYVINEDNKFYQWYTKQSSGSFYSYPSQRGKFIFWKDVTSAIETKLPFNKDESSQGIMEISIFDQGVWAIYEYREVYSVPPPNKEIEDLVLANLNISSLQQVPSSVSPPSSLQTFATLTSSAPEIDQLRCEDKQQCSEIDQVWNVISPKVNHQGQVYKPESASNGQWVPFTTLYPVPVTSSGATGGSGGYTSGSAIASVALQEYEDWGGKDECFSERLPILKKYWSVLGLDYPCSTAWSAAFISYVLKTAGVTDFPVASFHTTYFTSIRDNPQDYSCTTFPMAQKSQIKVGDIVCNCRGAVCQNFNYETIAAGNFGHCDIVVSNDGGKIYGVGGNLGDSVDKNELNLNKPEYYGFISCSSNSVSFSGQKTVVIDSGHGTRLNVRAYEDKIVLDVGLKLQQKLQSQGITVVMTRTTTGGDIGIANSDNEENYNRAKIANSNNADLIVHLHSDASVDPGFFILYPSCSGKDRTGLTGPADLSIIPKSARASNIIKGSIIQNDFLASTQSNKGDGVIGSCEFYTDKDLLTYDAASRVPSLTIEMYGHGATGSPGPSRQNKGDATDAYFDYLENTNGIKDKMAEGLANGIMQYLNSQPIS
jgi:N-acetylmuramoyl-L-alanine amidase